MLHLVSDRSEVPAYNSSFQKTARSVWILSISSRKASVFSQLRASPTATGQSQPAAPVWWLEPEVGMQLEAYADDSHRNEAVERHLARLIAGVLNVARAGWRYDDLIVVALPSICDNLRRYLSPAARDTVIAEIGVCCDSDIQELQTVLHRDMPDRFS